MTHGLEGRCSIQLSYWRAQSRGRQEHAFSLLLDIVFLSGRADLNGRPPAPKAGALPGCATPRHCGVHLQVDDIPFRLHHRTMPF